MDSSGIAVSRLLTHDFDVWRESIKVVYDVEPSPEHRGAPFEAAVTAFQLGDMVVGDVTLGSQRYIRDARRVRRDGMDQFVLNFYRTGGWRAQTPRGDFTGKAGQVCVLDLARELISDEPRCDLVAVFVPRSLIEERLPNLSALHGRAPTGPYAVLLAEYMDLLARSLLTLPAGSERAINRATCEMLIACLAPSLDRLEASGFGIGLVLQNRAKRFIEQHLRSPELSVDEICRRTGVARRTLFRLFELEGGVQHYIQARRLECVRDALSDPRETRRIADIAAEFGFSRGDHFARSFKQHHGPSPRDVRQAVTRYPNSGPDTFQGLLGEAQSFGDWIRALHA